MGNNNQPKTGGKEMETDTCAFCGRTERLGRFGQGLAVPTGSIRPATYPRTGETIYLCPSCRASIGTKTGGKKMEEYLIVWTDSLGDSGYEEFEGTFKEALAIAKKDGRPYQIKVWRKDLSYRGKVRLLCYDTDSDDYTFPMYVDVNDEGYLEGGGRVSID